MGDKRQIDSKLYSQITKEQREWADGIINKYSHLPAAEKACAIARHIIGEEVSKIASEEESGQMVVMK